VRLAEVLGAEHLRVAEVSAEALTGAVRSHTALNLSGQGVA
jgi:hypothetical protein